MSLGRAGIDHQRHFLAFREPLPHVSARRLQLEALPKVTCCTVEADSAARETIAGSAGWRAAVLRQAAADNVHSGKLHASCRRSAPARSAPVRSAPARLARWRSAAVRFARVRFAVGRNASTNRARVRLPPEVGSVEPRARQHPVRSRLEATLVAADRLIGLTSPRLTGCAEAQRFV